MNRIWNLESGIWQTNNVERRTSNVEHQNTFGQLWSSIWWQCKALGSNAASSTAKYCERVAQSITQQYRRTVVSDRLWLDEYKATMKRTVKVYKLWIEIAVRVIKRLRASRSDAAQGSAEAHSEAVGTLLRASTAGVNAAQRRDVNWLGGLSPTTELTGEEV